MDPRQNAQRKVQRIYQERPEVIRGGKEDKKEVGHKEKGAYDYTLLVLVGVLFAFGLLMIYSGSQFTALRDHKDATFYFKKQLTYGGVAFVAAIILSKFDYHLLEKWTWVPLAAYAASFILPVITLFSGSSSNGKTRWMSVLGVSFQPAEITKLGIIVSLSCFLAFAKGRINDKKVFGWTLAFCAIPALLIFAQNLSSGFIIMFIACVMLFVASRHWVLFAVAGGFGLTGLLTAKPLIRLAVANGRLTNLASHYWMRRLLAWALPEMYEDEAFQTTQGLYAIGSGGLTGRGLGESIQKFGKIPEVQNDMIFTVICEEFGFLGALSVILIYALIIWRIYVIGKNAKDKLGAMLCVGVMAHLGIQVVLNLAVVSGAFPNTGVTLPFISYGGTAIILTMLEIGMVLCVSNRNTAEIR